MQTEKPSQTFVCTTGAIIRPVKSRGGLFRYQIFDPSRGLFPAQGQPRTKRELAGIIEAVSMGFGGGRWV